MVVLVPPREGDAEVGKYGGEWRSVSRWTVVAEDESIAVRARVTVPPLWGTLSPVSAWTHVHTQVQISSLPMGKLHPPPAYQAYSSQISHTKYPQLLPWAT